MDKLVSIPFLIFLPLVISFFILSPFFTNNEIYIRRFVKSVCCFHFLYAIFVYLMFNPEEPYFSNINILGLDWIQTMGVKFSFCIDKISLVLVILTSFIFMIAAIVSKLHIRKNHKLYYSMLLLLFGATLGIFTANDMFLFFLFWELELIPAYFLIGGKWSSEDNSEAKKSAIKYVIYTFAGSVIMLLGMLLLHYYNYITTGVVTASLSEFLTEDIPENIQYFISICFLIGFGVKLPIIPLHAWLPDAHTQAPTPVSIVLAGVLLKTGAYGIYKFNYLIMDNIFIKIVPILGILALVNTLYAAFIAYAQTDIKRIVAYSSISNMGLILLGLCAFNQIGLSASVFHMVAHALVSAGLFIICGIVLLRCKTRDINILSGIATKMPRFFGFAVLIVLASVGVPLFAPFIGEIMTILSALYSDVGTVIKVIAICSLPFLIASSCYMLKFLHRSFYGEISENWSKINDVSIHECVVLILIVTALILFGLYPNVILGLVG